MKNSKSDVQVKVGAKVDPKLERKIQQIDKRLQASQKKQLAATKKAEQAAKAQARALGGLVSAQKAEAHSTVQSAKAFELLSKDLQRTTHLLARYNSEARRTTKTNKTLMHSLGKVAKGAREHGGTALAMAGRVTGVAAIGVTAAMGVGSGINYAAKMQRVATKLGLKSGMDKDQSQQMLTKIYDMAARPDIATSPEAILDAIFEVQRKTGDLSLGTDNMETIAKLISGGELEGVVAGGLFTAFKTMGLTDSVASSKEAADMLLRQGEAGALELKEFVQYGLESMSMYSARGLNGMDSLRELMALYQTAMSATNNEAKAATSVDATIRDLVANSQALQDDLGIDVFKDEGHTKLRPVSDILFDLLRETGGDATLIDDYLQSEAAPLITALQGSKGKGVFDTTRKVKGDGATLDEFSSAYAQDALGKFSIFEARGKKSVVMAAGNSPDIVGDAAVRSADTLERIAKFLDEKLYPMLPNDPLDAYLKALSYAPAYKIYQGIDALTD